MTYEARIREKLDREFAGALIEILNESPQHGLPPEAEKHFRVLVVSPAFEGLSRIERHRKITDLLAAELKEHIHALALQTYTAPEWEKRGGQGFSSPACLGGGKRER